MSKKASFKLPKVSLENRSKPQTIDEFKAIKINSTLFPDPIEKDHTAPPATDRNLDALLTIHGIRVRYDMVKKEVDIFIPGLSSTLDNHHAAKLSCIASICKLNRYKTTDLQRSILAIADKNAFHPTADWILSKQWDGRDRLPDMYATLTVKTDLCPEWYRNLLTRKWLISMVAAALKPNDFKSRGVLTLQGDQGIGKTSWVRSLMPAEISPQYIKVDHHLDPSNKDSVMTAISHWVVEIGEVDSSFKKDISRLKGFLTSDTDKFRRPYGSTDSEYPRRTVFFASVNQADFLVDNTGNSRWWVLPVTKINFNHNIDTQQLFAQLATELENGAEWWLDEGEEQLLELHNKDYQTTSIIKESLLQKFDLSRKSKPQLQAMTASGVLREITGIKNPTNPQAKECAAILRELLGEPKRIQGLNKWRIPLKLNDHQRDFRVKRTLDPDADEDGY